MTLTLTFQGHSRSNPMVHLDSPYMVSYQRLIVTTSHRLGVITTRNFFSYLLSLGPNFGPPAPTLTPGRFFFQNLIVSASVTGKAPTKNEIDSIITFWDILSTDTRTDKRKVRNPAMQKHGLRIWLLKQWCAVCKSVNNKSRTGRFL